jgi:hypothetical protein
MQRESEKRDLLRNRLIDEEVKKANRHRIIRTLELDSENWLNPENLEEKMEKLLVIPDIVES